MKENTMNYGIDLGTTNSCIAILKDGKPEIIENIDGNKYTPSAVGIRKSKIYVGQRAINMVNSGDKNAHKEFKLQMGNSYEYEFPSEGVKMTPEELSAEVLKSLINDVKQRIGEDVVNAVISVPAAFNSKQRACTLEAAKKAGLHAYLISEPIAAALAYGFENVEDSTIWLVYDFGGGTFDATIIQIINGEFGVLNHMGDSYLGGKYIDWKIVDELFVPAIKSEYNSTDFNRGNPKWKSAFAKLKKHAEEAKIGLSKEDTVYILDEVLGLDNDGQWITFEYELRYEELSKIMEPLVEKSINICKDAINGTGLCMGDISKVIMAGDSTLSPALRKIVREKLPISQECTMDTKTVIAKGAAIYAKSIPRCIPNDSGDTDYILNFTEYDPLNTEYEPLIAGNVEGKELESFDGFHIEFLEPKSQWSSGKLALNSVGEFITILEAKNKINEFKIILTDKKGNTLKTSPEKISYIHSLKPKNTINNSIGTGLITNKMESIVKKGELLPLSIKKVFFTSRHFIKGESGNLLTLPIYESENKKTDRNQLIGFIIVDLNDIEKDIPIGTKIEVEFNINESREIKANANIPFIDHKIENVFNIEKKVIPKVEELKKEFMYEKERLKYLNLEERIEDDNSIKRLNDTKEKLISEIKSLLKVAETDPDAADKCQISINDLKMTIDITEDHINLIELERKINKELEEIKYLISNQDVAFLNEEIINTFNSLKKEILEEILPKKDRFLIQEKMYELDQIKMEIVMRDPKMWIETFFQIKPEFERNYANFRDSQYARELILNGQRAVCNGDIKQLKSIIHQLVNMLPSQRTTDTYPHGGILPC